MPAIGSVTPSSSASPTTSEERTSRGSSTGSTPNSSSSSAAQSRVSRSRSIVRDAFVRSVACTRPPVSFQTSHESTVPKASSPRGSVCAREQPLELRGGEVGIGDEACSGPHAARRAASRQRSAVRRSCQTIAGATGVPVARSQRIVVSRWFVIPIAASSDGRIPAARDRLLGRAEHGLPELLGIVLDPARLRVVLRELAVAAAAHAELAVDGETRRAGRPLVDREDHDREQPLDPTRTASESRPVTASVVRRRRTSSALTAHSCLRAYSTCASTSRRLRRAAREGRRRSPPRQRAVGPRQVRRERWSSSGCRRRRASAATSGSAAPGSGRGRRSIRCSSSSARSWCSTASAMRRYVVSFPPATETIPSGPLESTVSRWARAVATAPTGSTRRRRSGRGRARVRRRPGRAPASSRICRSSAAVGSIVRASPSKALSVVPTEGVPPRGRRRRHASGRSGS